MRHSHPWRSDLRAQLALVALAVCVGTAAHANAASDSKAIETVLQRQEAAWNRGDIDSFMNGYWNSPDVRFVSGDKIVSGWAATLARYHTKYATRAKMGKLSFSALRVDMLAADSALVVGRWQLIRAGDTPNGVFTLIFRKLHRKWMIVLDHTS